MGSNKYEINGEISRRAKFVHFFMPTANKSFFKIARPFLSLLYKGKKQKGYLKNEIFIGKDKIRTCVYSRISANAQKRPLILWLHGGGFGLGIPEYEFNFIKDLLDATDCVVLAPDYTLSYKASYPKALLECYDVLLWAKENADKLGANPNCIFVGGDSAGGGLTIALCLYARDKNEVKISFQMPIYPMLDDRETKTNVGNTAPLWTSKSNNNAWKLYLGENYRKKDAPYYGAPARCDDYSNMPPAVTYIGNLDLFLDETKTFIEKMRASGIDASLQIFEGCYHGFDVLCPNSKIARSARAFLTEEFTKAVKKFNI